MSNYNPNDIFNADQTGVFFLLLPDKMLECMRVDCHGGKSSKELTVLFVPAQKTYPLLVLGKLKNHNALKSVKKPHMKLTRKYPVHQISIH
jgi:hypothetical protein